MTTALCITAGVIVGDVLWRLWCWRKARRAHHRVAGRPVLYYVAGGRR